MIIEKGRNMKKANHVPGVFRLVILLAGSLLAFASCQTVPYAPKRATEQSALLVVPLEFKTRRAGRSSMS
jgi:hypothetical protein